MKVQLSKGGEAVVSTSDGDHLTLSSTVSLPPGATLDGTLTDGTPIRVKVRGCKKTGDRYTIEGRLIDASRELRARLAG